MIELQIRGNERNVSLSPPSATRSNFSSSPIRGKKLAKSSISSSFRAYPRYLRGRRQLARGHREKILGCRYDSILVAFQLPIRLS